ncbi:unnamed protein product [Caenorhabditis auriculariae]|uniref:Uncharacterized protein n=1 Tax=Caenorhabditis auriculariae TaxID=2777116 RepID=A0A8S1GWL4_9PELO|nr:unnamed protein product [Caenorhabditis auriculariae]
METIMEEGAVAVHLTGKSPVPPMKFLGEGLLRKDRRKKRAVQRESRQYSAEDAAVQTSIEMDDVFVDYEPIRANTVCHPNVQQVVDRNYRTVVHQAYEDQPLEGEATLADVMWCVVGCVGVLVALILIGLALRAHVESLGQNIHRARVVANMPIFDDGARPTFD